MVMDAVAIRQSVQKTPPKDALPISSSFYAVTERGPILPRYGSKHRDERLRKFYRNEYNTLFQGAISGLIKKITSAPWELTGGQTGSKYYQDILQDAHFGRGWKEFVTRVLIDYFTQDFGAVIEVIGPGEPEGPITGAVTGLAHLDALRCFATGNYEFPIVYFNSYSSKMHRMHYTRVMRIVDMPDPDERLYGSGMCALSRAIAIVERELLIGRYIEQSLDDKPPPGLMIASNITEGELAKAVGKYKRDQQSDERPVWGDTLWLHSVDPTAPAKVEPIPFSKTPDKFSFTEYTNLHINALALALGVDKQELWELQGGGLGTGTQSQMLAQKSKGKAFGDILSTLERVFNIAILPDGINFEFKFKDEESDEAQARVDQAYITIAQSMAGMGKFSDVEIRALLVDRSETFKQVLTNTQGQVQATDDDRIAATTETTLSDASTPEPTVEEPTSESKAFGATSSEFETQFESILTRATERTIARPQYEIFALASLQKAGRSAFLDGLKQGGVTEMDEDDSAVVQGWLIDQIDYISKLGDEIYTKGLSDAQIPQRARMWINKSVEEMLNAGRMSADRNAPYEWVLGSAEEHCATCKRMNGQVHRLKEYFRRNILPKSKKLECGGWECTCKIRRTTKAAQGRF